MVAKIVLEHNIKLTGVQYIKMIHILPSENNNFITATHRSPAD
jgi:hypothetical protein